MSRTCFRGLQCSSFVLGRAEGAKDALLGLQYFSLVCGSSSNANVLQGRTGFQTAEGREGHGVVT
ncbi:hypothetical protein KY290_012733 [Solanum tuberosum]|uniref:Uncharacterized protein n=1 Tax=Solanum tuberosum TaxID=4113 RepID=A0ABQ7VMR7_SOLTU|nr:hypothetical protein KY285_012608 [Solanum tuberosum]KAH0768752.1 hypothetical protein KY290_012733 [Solanum tuberosum]